MPKTIRWIAVNGVIAALYCVMTMVMGQFGYGPFQLRPSEALTILPFLFPQTIPGLFLGCALANAFSQFGMLDIIFGSLATLLAAFLTSRCKKLWLAALPPIVINAIVVGALIVVATPDAGWIAWPVQAGLLAITQTLSCAGLGIPLALMLRKLPISRHLFTT